MVKWSNLETARWPTAEEILAMVEDDLNRPLQPTMIPAEAILRLCQSGHVTKEDVERGFPGSVIFGGAKTIAKLHEEFDRILTNRIVG